MAPCGQVQCKIRPGPIATHVYWYSMQDTMYVVYTEGFALFIIVSECAVNLLIV